MTWPRAIALCLSVIAVCAAAQLLFHISNWIAGGTVLAVFAAATGVRFLWSRRH